MFSTPLICCSSGVDDGGGDHVGAGAGILAGDVDHRRRDLGILGDRQPAEGDDAQDHEHERHDAGEDRPVDEEARDAHGRLRCLSWPWSELLAAAEASALPAGSCGVTLTPGRARIRPLTMTRSSGVEPCRDHAQAVDDRTQRHVLRPRDVLAVDHEHELAHLLGADGDVRHQQRLVGGRDRHLDAREHAGRERAVGIGELGAAADGAGRAVDGVVDEVHLALVRELGLVDQLEPDRHVDAAVGGSPRRRRRGACSAGRKSHPW